MTNLTRRPGDDTDEPIESRRTTSPRPDPSEPVLPEEGEMPSPDLPSFGELAPESARSTPLDDIAEAERERAPRD